MPTLKKNTFATQIHGTTGQEIAETVLEEDTQYEVGEHYCDAMGYLWTRIMIDDYVYEVAQGDLTDF